MSAHSYLYERLVCHRGYLILPFQCGTISGADIYSYQLLCAFERRGKFHKVVNPAELYTDSIEAIVVIAQDFLDIHSDLLATSSYEQQRYVYQGNLILISQIAEKFFYDHYPPGQLTNLAAPKLFESEADCITWVKQGIDRLHNASVAS